MAEVTKSSSASMDASTGMYAPQLTGLILGEDVVLGDACYIKQADGKVYRCSGAAADEKAVLAGFVPRDGKAGQPCTLFALGTCFRYADGTLTQGAKLFLSGTVAGGLATVATTGDAVGVARAINDSDIQITRVI